MRKDNQASERRAFNLCSILAALAAATSGCGVRSQDPSDSGSGDGDSDGHSECAEVVSIPNISWARFREGAPSYDEEGKVYVLGNCVISAFEEGMDLAETVEVLLVRMACTTDAGLYESTFGDSVTLEVSRAVDSPAIEALAIGSELTIEFMAEPKEWGEASAGGRVIHEDKVLAVWGGGFVDGGATGDAPASALEPSWGPTSPWYPFEATSEYGVCAAEAVDECMSNERFGFRMPDGVLLLDGRPAQVAAGNNLYEVQLSAEKIHWYREEPGCEESMFLAENWAYFVIWAVAV